MSNDQSSFVNRPSTIPKRQRLSKKQLGFFNEVFEAGQPVTDALRNLRIRPSTFDRWLTNPLFLNKLRMYLNQYHIQARMELARCTTDAISGLSFLSEKSLKHKEVRHACNDILKIHTQFAKAAAAKKSANNGVTAEHFGVLLEQFGVVLDNKSVTGDKLGNTNTPQNRILTTENKENQNCSHQ